MERKIGEVFTDGQIELITIKSTTCTGCFYSGKNKRCTKDMGVAGYCAPKKRKDAESIIFKIEK